MHATTSAAFEEITELTPEQLVAERSRFGFAGSRSADTRRRTADGALADGQGILVGTSPMK